MSGASMFDALSGETTTPVASESEIDMVGGEAVCQKGMETARAETKAG